MTERPRQATWGQSLAPCTRLLVGTQRCPCCPPPLDCGSGAPSADVMQGDAPCGLSSRNPQDLEAQRAASSLPLQLLGAPSHPGPWLAGASLQPPLQSPEPSMGPAPGQPAIQPKGQTLASGHGTGSFTTPPQRTSFLCVGAAEQPWGSEAVRSQEKPRWAPELASLVPQQLRLCGRLRQEEGTTREAGRLRLQLSSSHRACLLLASVFNEALSEIHV